MQGTRNVRENATSQLNASVGLSPSQVHTILVSVNVRSVYSLTMLCLKNKTLDEMLSPRSHGGGINVHIYEKKTLCSRLGNNSLRKGRNTTP